MQVGADPLRCQYPGQKEDYLNSCVLSRSESLMKRPLLLAMTVSVLNQAALTRGYQKKRKPSLTCDKTCKWQKCLHLQRGGMGRYFPFVFLMSGNISIPFGEGRTRALPGRTLCSKVHAMNPLQPTAFLDGCSKVETAKLGKAHITPFPPIHEELGSVASENLVNPGK